GIDIGGLDASIVAGFPGSFNSFWQQSGRAGRRGGTSVSVFIASSSPLDQFIMQNNEWFFAKSAEEGRIDPENPYIFTDHVKCATFELPFKISSKESRKEEVGRRKCGDSGLFGDNLQDALDYLAEDGIIRKIESRQTPTDDNLPTSYFLLSTYYWSDRSYPAEGISLRSATADNVVIIDVTKGRNAVIGEMDRPSAKEMVFKNAVYLHRGRQFIVENLDIENRKCLVVEADVNYFTDGLVKRDIKVLSEDEEISSRGDAEAQRSDKQCEIVFKVTLGDILVRSQVSKFKKIKFWTHENIGYGDIDLSEEEMQTRALMLTFPPDTKAGQYLQAFERTEDAGAALSGAGTLIKQIAPVYLLCDSRDIGIAERVRDPHFGIPALYIYDKYPGGTGLAEALAEKLNGLFHAAYETVAQCSCKNGCPSCVGPAGGKAEAKGLLRALIV
ncbi:MAG: DUF1998 domain-containing protein, partial [Spirochaetaceae bacterium]|nr:DUF1998 domain-containing protein [Spirochaetaceae bacterium]